MNVLLYGAVARRGLDILGQRFGDGLQIVVGGEDDAEEALAGKFAGAEVIVSVGFSANLPPAPAARLLHLPNSGLDAVDMAAVPDGCAICNCFEHEIGIGEYVMAAILRHSVGLEARDVRFKGGDWGDSPAFSAPYRRELAGQVVATLGYGNIGRAVASRARAFGMVTHAVTRTPRDFDPAPDWLGAIEDLDTMLPVADFVVACCPLTDQTRGILDARRLSLMKPTAVLINVCRGPVVDEDALFAACRDKSIAGAVIDVWYRYAHPGGEAVRPSRHAFHELDNVAMTPHLSGWTDGLMPRRFSVIGDNIQRLIDGLPLVHQVHP
jgi:phosphoglycerate dehydrogenase-like enzyme